MEAEKDRFPALWREDPFTRPRVGLGKADWTKYSPGDSVVRHICKHIFVGTWQWKEGLGAWSCRFTQKTGKNWVGFILAKRNKAVVRGRNWWQKSECLLLKVSEGLDAGISSLFRLGESDVRRLRGVGKVPLPRSLLLPLPNLKITHKKEFFQCERRDT